MPLILAPVASGKSLLDSIEQRGRFPSPKVRWCTSSLKRGPIERKLRRYLKANPRFGGRIVSAMGMRAEESPARARKSPWQLNERNSRAGRIWFDWLPILDLTEREVFRVIRDAGQSPHPAYAMGTSRFSCVFCIMASRADLRTAAEIGHNITPLQACKTHRNRVPLCRHRGAPLPPDKSLLQKNFLTCRAPMHIPSMRNPG